MSLCQYDGPNDKTLALHHCATCVRDVHVGDRARCRMSGPPGVPKQRIAQADGTTVIVTPATPRPLVGTVLSTMLAWVKDLPGSGCGSCSGLAALMDEFGPHWCQVNIDQHAAAMASRRPLLEQSLRSLGIWGQVTGMLASLAPDAALRWGAKRLIEKAIKHATDNPMLPPVTGASRPDHDRSLIGQHWESDNALILTAADDKFAPGAYLALATAARFNRVPMAFVSLGCDRGNPFVKQIAKLATVIEWPESGAVRNWQTWFKPRYIEWGLTQAERVIWLDADTTTGGSLAPLGEPGLFIPDHGFYTPKNNGNRPEFYQRMPLPKRRWGDQMPCAGIIAVGQSEADLVREWRDRCNLAISDPVIEKAAGYYDQGPLQDLVDCELQDGRVWNNLQSRRDGTLDQVIADSTAHSVIMHFGGAVKPWSKWGNDWHV